MDHDQLFKAVLSACLVAFLELFFPELVTQIDLTQARFVDKELFSAPPMGPGREVDLVVEAPVRAPAGAALSGSGAGREPGGARVAIWIEIQAQRDPAFIWRMLEYYALVHRIMGLPVLPIALFPLVDVLGRERGRRPRVGYERVQQREAVLGQTSQQFEMLAVTLRALDAETYLARPQALAGALAALMRRPAQSPPSAHKLACLRRIIEGSGVEREEVRQLLLDVVEAYLRLSGADAEEFEQLLQQPENEGIRQTMKTWTEQQQEIGEARGREIGEEIGKEIGKRIEAQEAVLRVLAARFHTVPPAVAERVRHMDDVPALEALLGRVATAATLAETGLV